MRRQRRRRRLTRNLVLAGVIVLAAAAVVVWARGNIRLALNTTESLRSSLFLVLMGTTPDKGDYVALTAPQDHDAAGMWFLKRVGGVGGDVIDYANGNIRINGNVIGYVKPVSLAGRPLRAIAPGPIPPGRYFVYATHGDSYDSRYQAFGPVDHDRIIGRAIPLL